jgi:hypothetical protein
MCFSRSSLVHEFLTPAQYYLILSYLSQGGRKKPRYPTPSAHYCNKAEKYTNNLTPVSVISQRQSAVCLYIKTYSGLEVRVHSYLITAVNGSKCSASRSGKFLLEERAQSVPTEFERG